MKAELTPILKARLFALYWGQPVVERLTEDPFWKDRLDVVDWYMVETLNESFLKLRQISQLSDDEAIEVAKIVWPKHTQLHTPEEGRWYVLKERATHPNDYLSLCDYLRSIGIALPFMGHSVEELVNVGWVKLTN
jgi:hypothetical protein